MKKGTIRSIDGKKSRIVIGIIPAPCSAALKFRSEGQCERLGCKNKGVHRHHILARSQGGIYELSNLLYLCFSCHRFAHDHPFVAVQEGLIIPYKGFKMEDFKEWRAAKLGILCER